MKARWTPVQPMRATGHRIPTRGPVGGAGNSGAFQPPRGPSGGSDAQPKFEFTYDTWTTIKTESNWEGYASGRTDLDGASGRYKESNVVKNEPTRTIVRASAESEAVQKMRDLFETVSSPVETRDHWHRMSRVTTDRHFMLIEVREV